MKEKKEKTDFEKNLNLLILKKNLGLLKNASDDWQNYICEQSETDFHIDRLKKIRLLNEKVQELLEIIENF